MQRVYKARGALSLALMHQQYCSRCATKNVHVRDSLLNITDQHHHTVVANNARCLYINDYNFTTVIPGDVVRYTMVIP